MEKQKSVAVKDLTIDELYARYEVLTDAYYEERLSTGKYFPPSAELQEIEDEINNRKWDDRNANCICGGAMRSESIRILIPRRFRNRIQSQQIKRLHSPVVHSRDPQRSEFPVAFRDIHPP